MITNQASKPMVLIGAGALLLALTAGISTAIYASRSKATLELAQVVDLRADGSLELIRIFSPRTGSSRVELISLEQDRVLWYRDTDPVSCELLQDCIAVNSSVLVLRHNAKSTEHPCILSAISLETGEVLWQASAERSWSPLKQLWADDSLLFTSTELHGISTLAAFDIFSGELAWEEELSGTLRSPIDYESYLLAQAEDLLVIDKRTGTSTVLEGSSGAVLAGGSSLLVGRADSLVEQAPYVLTQDGGGQVLSKLTPSTGELTPVLLDKLPVRAPAELRADRAAAIYKGTNLLLAMGPEPSKELISLPLRPDLQPWSLTFPHDLGMRTVFYQWKDSHPHRSAFHSVQSRFMPLFLRKEGEQRLAVVDLEQGALSWLSKALHQDDTRMTARQIVQADGDYLLRLSYDIDDEERGALLLFSGKSGLVKSTAQIAELSSYPTLHASQAEHSVLSGHQDGLSWVLSMKDLSLFWGDVTLQSAESELEEILGSLPKDEVAQN